MWDMAAKRSTKRAKSKTSSRPRAGWKGNLSFGLVTFPVQAINAINREEGDIHFHQLHAGCHRRIRYQKVCPVHGEVSQDEIVSGYEFKKGKYVEIEPEELDSLRTDRDRAFTIDTFVEPDAIDPLYFDGRMYYLLPDGSAAAEPYAVVLEALSREGRHGIGQLIFSGKEQLAMIRPFQGVLHMAMLNYDEELRLPGELSSKHARAADKRAADKRKVKLAQTLIRSWSADEFDFEKYDDPHRERVAELIKAKVAGRPLAPPQDEETPEVINLMDALKQSVKARTPRKRTARKRRRSA
jgi:DNA end-binding protein Ku